jgi:uncharacterized protein (DUF697 family)
MALPNSHRDIIIGSSKAAAALGLPSTFAPGLDIVGITGIWSNMVIKIAYKSGHQVDSNFTMKFVQAVAGGLSGYVVGCKVFTTLLHFIPGVGTLGAMGINGFLNYIFTYRLGKLTAEMFDRPNFNFSDYTSLATKVIMPLIAVPSLHEIRELADFA